MKLPENYIQMEQGSAEWLQARAGSLTASRIADVITKLKSGKESAARIAYKMQLLTERLTGSAAQHYVSMEMAFGTENEPLARTAYEFAKAVQVERIGYVRHPHIPQSGASPDGLVADDGLVEIKVPNTSTHLEYLLAQTVPEEYLAQMMWQMACTGRQWCDFVSHDPRLPQEYGLFIIRQHRDEKLIALMEQEVTKFLNEVDDLFKTLQSRKSEYTWKVDLPGEPPPRAEIPTYGDD